MEVYSMKEKIKNKLIYYFVKKNKRNPNISELKKIEDLSWIYSRDMDYILKMEVKETF